MSVKEFRKVERESSLVILPFINSKQTSRSFLAFKVKLGKGKLCFWKETPLVKYLHSEIQEHVSSSSSFWGTRTGCCVTWWVLWLPLAPRELARLMVLVWLLLLLYSCHKGLCLVKADDCPRCGWIVLTRTEHFLKAPNSHFYFFIIIFY